MNTSQMLFQEQPPKNRSSLWVRLGSAMLSLLAGLWRLLIWIWGILIVGAIAGILGNVGYTYFTSGTLTFKDPRTLTVTTWMQNNQVLCLLILLPLLAITLSAFLAHRWQYQRLQQHQRDQGDALVVLAKGVQRTLDELNEKATPSRPPVTSSNASSKENPSPEKIWTIPYQRNPFFTGREDLLTQLHEQLTATNATALTQSQAISGLGGIGKTQIALEYAYRYQKEYTSVLWLNTQSPETLLTEFITLADLLHLPQPEKDEHYQIRLIALVKQWFVQHERWLLILDNADNFNAIKPFIPTGGKGHLILTTREHTTGSIASIPIEKMSLEEGTAFLLRRAKLSPSSATDEQIAQKNRTQAGAIVQALDGLPLALDQAGAYLEETPSCSLSNYLEYYNKQRQKYLARQGRTNTEHASVTATFLLCFTQVSEQNALAADLLRCLVFLDAEDIPLDMLQAGASELGPHLQTISADASLLDEAISELLRYSLVHYNQERYTCSIHRLVQVVLRDEMPAEERHLWAERIVQAINQAFPISDVTTWQQCQRYLPHAQSCITWIEQEQLQLPEAASLLSRLAYYLHDQALYAEALPLLQRALTIREQMLGPNHPNTALSLNNLAELYDSQGEYEQAEPLLQRALAIREQVLGPNHPDTATSFNNLAALYNYQGQYEQAEPLYQRALAIAEQTLGPNHPNTRTVRTNLENCLRKWNPQ